jgi:hypothetical protein
MMSRIKLFECGGIRAMKTPIIVRIRGAASKIPESASLKDAAGVARFGELRHSEITRSSTIPLTSSRMGIGARGAATPNSGSIKFMKNVEIIKNAKLNPTEKSTVSSLSSLNFESRRMTNPGINVRKRKPITCLATGISNNIVKKSANCITSAKTGNVPGLYELFDFICTHSPVAFVFPILYSVLK